MSLTVVGNISRAGQVELSASISVYCTHSLQLFTVHSCVGLQSCQTQDITFSIFRCCSCSTLINPVSRTRIIVRAWDFPFLSSNLAVTIQTESSPLRNISHRSVDVSLADCNFLPHYPRTGRQVCVVLHVTQRD